MAAIYPDSVSIGLGMGSFPVRTWPRAPLPGGPPIEQLATLGLSHDATCRIRPAHSKSVVLHIEHEGEV